MVGVIQGVTVGQAFADREALRAAGIHRQNQAGIAGTGESGAESIVLNEGYEDDEDHGDWVVYTGQGGRDVNTGRQIADQQLTRGNLALAKSHAEGLPIRVVRGPRLTSSYAPTTGYRYDGLYFVEDFWEDTGKAGFKIWRFRLRRDDPERPSWAPLPALPEPAEPGRRETTVQRIIRNTAVATRVKALHGYRCQVCGTALHVAGGFYAEGAHIRPLGSPNGGPDVAENILCLCPNHHVLFE